MLLLEQRMETAFYTRVRRIDYLYTFYVSLLNKNGERESLELFSNGNLEFISNFLNALSFQL